MKKHLSSTMNIRHCKKLIVRTMTLLLGVQGINPFSRFTGNKGGEVHATYTQNDNAGSYELTFLNPEGIVERQGLVVTGGVMFLGEGFLTGKFLTSQIEPASIRHWDRLSIDKTDPSGSSSFISLIDCNSDETLPNWEKVPYTGTPLSLSGIDKTLYSCLQVQVDVERTEAE
jgi:hypothetical protein